MILFLYIIKNCIKKSYSCVCMLLLYCRSWNMRSSGMRMEYATCRIPGSTRLLFSSLRSCRSWTNKQHRHQRKNLKKLTCKGTLRQVFICLRSLPLLGFCLRWSSNLHPVSYWVKKLLQKTVYNRTQHPPPPPSHTVCIYCTLTRGRVEPERRLEGNILQIWVD